MAKKQKENAAPAKESAFSTLVYPVIILVVICVVCSALLALLKQQLPDFIRRAQGGALRRRLEARGFAFR